MFVFQSDTVDTCNAEILEEEDEVMLGHKAKNQNNTKVMNGIKMNVQGVKKKFTNKYVTG